MSNFVQTGLMNVSHFILGIYFCTANGHNYVAKWKGAINKTELSTKFCRKPSATASPSMAWGKSKRYLKESHEKRKAKYQFGLYLQEGPVGVGNNGCSSPGAVWDRGGPPAGPAPCCALTQPGGFLLPCLGTLRCEAAW